MGREVVVKLSTSHQLHANFTPTSRPLGAPKDDTGKDLKWTQNDAPNSSDWPGPEWLGGGVRTWGLSACKPGAPESLLGNLRGRMPGNLRARGAGNLKGLKGLGPESLGPEGLQGWGQEGLGSFDAARLGPEGRGLVSLEKLRV